MNKILTLSTYILLTLFISSCTSKKEEDNTSDENNSIDLVTLTEPQFKNAGIKTRSVETRTVSTVLKLNGKIDVPPQNMVSISIPLGGYLKSTIMLPGKPVSKGQVLAVIEDNQYIQIQQDYLITQSKLEFAEQEQNRQTELNKEKAGSDKALQLATAEYRSLRITLGGLAEKLLLIGINPAGLTEKNISRQIVVRSPINGFVSQVNGNIGTYFNPSDVLIELIDPSDIHLSLFVFEKDLNKLSTGQSAIAYTNNNPEKKHETRISLISSDLSADGNAEIHCHFEKYDKNLAPGMYMNAEIAVKAIQAHTLPEKSVVSFEGKQYIFIEKASKTYKMTEITAGETENGYIAIKTDLGKQRIVTEGAYSLLMQLKNIGE